MLEQLRANLRALTGRADEALVGLLVTQADATLEGARLVRGAVAELPTAETRERMGEAEQAGDDARAELVEALAHALVTPMDREDLFRVSRSVDDVLDNLRDFARELDLFAVERETLFEPLLDAVVAGVEVLREALVDITERADEVGDAALRATKQANRVRRLYQEQMAHLLDGEVSTGMLKRRELLRRLDVVGLRLGEAADALADAALKRGY